MHLAAHAVEVPLRGGYCPRAVSCGRSRLRAPTSRPVSFLLWSTCPCCAHFRTARLSSSSQYLLRLFSYRPIGRSFASRHSYLPRTVRSTAAAPTTIADRFAPAYSLRSTYRIVPWRRRTLRTVSSYPPAGRVRFPPVGVCAPSTSASSPAAASPPCARITAATLASRVTACVPTRISLRPTNSARACTSRMQYRSSCSHLPSFHHLGASHPVPAFPPIRLSVRSVQSRPSWGTSQRRARCSPTSGRSRRRRRPRART